MAFIYEEYELVNNNIDMVDCNGARMQIGDWGKTDPEVKLRRCATEVKLDSRCGTSFFFRSTKGRCQCEVAGNTCPRETDPYYNEYRLITGMLHYNSNYQSNTYVIQKTYGR